MGRIDGCCSRASAFASWRKRASMPGVHAISGWSTLQASRRSRSLSHSSYTSAKPPRPTRRRTSYLDPSARARRCAVGVLAWRFQERVAFPAPRGPVPDPKRVGVANGETIELTTEDGTRLVGWYLASPILHHPPQPSQPAAGLLWFYGNGETVAAI